MPPSEALKKIRALAHIVYKVLTLVILLASFPVGAKSPDYLVSLVRHGDRSPRRLGNQAELWPMGAGQLTVEGVQQMLDLGREIRRRHLGKDFPEHWSFELSQHFSKGINRTLQSATALLQGVYQSTDKPTGLKGNIQIPPVYSMPLEKDFLFSSQHLCPGYVGLIQKAEQSPEWLGVQQQYDKQLKKWRLLAGVNGGIYPLASFMDRVTIHASHGLPLPDGITAEDARSMKEMLDWLLVSLGSNRSVAQLIVSPLIRSLINDFQQVMSCLRSRESNNCRKWTLYLGSDINLIAVMSLLGIQDIKNVKYASHLEMRLYWQEFEPEITVYYDDKPVDIPGCKAPCLLDSWLELLDKTLPDNWEQLCEIDSGPTLNESGLAHPAPDRKKIF